MFVASMRSRLFMSLAHMAVLAGAKRERKLAGSLQAGGAKAFGESEKSKTGAIAVLG